MTSAERFKLFVDALGAILIPVVLFILGQWFIRSKKQSDRARQDALDLAAFLDPLSSDSKERRKLALLALAHMQNARLFPTILFESVQSIAARDNPEVAAYAELALGKAHFRRGLSQEERTLLLEVLLPAKIHFDRSKRAFKRWVDVPPKKPVLVIEEAIKASNAVISDLLRTKWHILPDDLQDDAIRLLEHYDVWLEEYHRLRPGGVRNPTPPFVFVGPKGFPFPIESEDRFLARYAKLTSEGPSSNASQATSSLSHSKEAAGCR